MSARTVSELERYMRDFPEVPPEVVLKEDLLNLGQRFSKAALSHDPGMTKSYRLFSYDFVSMPDMAEKESRRIPEWFYIKGGPYSLREIQVQTRLSPTSPFVIDVVGGQLALTLDGTLICPIDYAKRPRYYDKSLPDGTAYGEIVANGDFITIYRVCQYWGPNDECRFCDINENVHQMHESNDFTLKAAVKTVDQVCTVVDEIQRESQAAYGYPVPIYFTMTGGTILKTLNGKKEDDFYGQYVEAVKWGGGRRYVILQTNAKDKETLRWYRSMGLDNHNANLEVWDRDLFRWICPGKEARVGRDNWVRCLLDSVEVFGEGNVTPNMVFGVEMARPHGFKTVDEAVKSTTDGLRHLMSHGVIPRMNHWCREAGSDLVKQHEQPDVPLEFFLRILQARYEFWKLYHLPLAGGGHYHRHPFEPERPLMGIFHGAYDDYICLKEFREGQRAGEPTSVG